ncbi:MAG TPA: class I SAM-dependent methyltransferase [Granulicella sp.]|jgi:SAM-dependent methyltransferase|nr:class I SAM-dependent methyltransferase [Granulicella sp.]
MAKRRATPAPVHPFDAAHGVETGGLIPAGELVTGHSSDAHVTAYYGVAPSILRGLVELWRETAPLRSVGQYSFIDIGAGKGRAMLVASELGFRQVIGIELNPAMADTAQRNLEHWTKSRAADETALRAVPVRVVEMDALEFEFPAGPAVAFLFHPFEAPLLRRLLRRMETQFAKRPGELDVLYVNAECAAVFDRNPAFRRLWFGKVVMSAEDHAADLAEIAQQKEYGSTGDEECGIYRYVGRGVGG